MNIVIINHGWSSGNSVIFVQNYAWLLVRTWKRQWTITVLRSPFIIIIIIIIIIVIIIITIIIIIIIIISVIIIKLML